jgi:hypothetical protein
MSDTPPLAVHEHQPGELDSTLRFLKRTWAEMRELRFVRVWPDRFQVVDVNADVFEVRNLGYADPDIIAALNAVNAAFNRETIHHPIDRDYKEFKTGRRYPWAHDRVL